MSMFTSKIKVVILVTVIILGSFITYIYTAFGSIEQQCTEYQKIGLQIAQDINGYFDGNGEYPDSLNVLSTEIPPSFSYEKENKWYRDTYCGGNENCPGEYRLRFECGPKLEFFYIYYTYEYPERSFSRHDWRNT